ncbi:TRAP transporter substrate-binding protein DctP [Sebaldella sp. S0638]|uniref:TRAP transporter substrate-binding protein DctP n=1 Tax=Sebaldella sp. S0638 TaxID=2957809 RepID=UPI00209F2280|nr:TRAP transporter substrate-binding protein DctP [Sebaldella sp. S0638]MCP1225998.1 TRAP transporter substrate-binding protein DctP [Sebaldella sp. S0638]
MKNYNEKERKLFRFCSKYSRQCADSGKRLLMVIFAVLFLPAAGLAEITLRYTDHEPLGRMRTQFIKDVFLANVEKESNGRIKIEDNWDSKVTDGYKALQAIGKDGTADIGIVVPEYSANELPLHQMFKSFPVGPTSDKQVAFFRRIYAEVPAFSAELEKENVVTIFISTGYPVAFFSTKPLNNLKDIKGEKWRSASFWHKDFLQNVGATPVTMPWNDGIFTALEDGSLDGLMVNIDGGDQLSVDKVAPNILFSEKLWMGHVYLLVMNKKTWDSLAEEDKKAIQRAAEISYKSLGSVMDSSFDKQIKDMRKGGAKIRTLRASELKQWETDTKYQEVQNAWVKEQEGKGVENVASTLEKVRVILNDSMK